MNLDADRCSGNCAIQFDEFTASELARLGTFAQQPPFAELRLLGGS
ncbi:MAG: hypothetical protein KF688_16280 [Pirellulales bacterium]|nr:hypothetical protein [Pirellulales bacterium]